MGIGMSEWQALNSHRGKYYTEPKKTYTSSKKSSDSEDSMVTFPLFNSDPFDRTSPTSKYDVATNAASTMWSQALKFAAAGKDEDAERLKNQVINSSTEKVVNALGYSYLNDGFTSLAIDVFTRNAEKHPDSWQAYFSLAEAWNYRGDTGTAIINYNKALSLTSDTPTKTKIQSKINALLHSL